MALTSPNHGPLKTTQPSTSIHTLASPNNGLESPSADNGTFRSFKCFSLQSDNVKRKLDLNGSVDLEETAIPGLHETLSAIREVARSTVCHQQPKSHVDLQSTTQIVCRNKVFEQEPTLPTHNFDSLLCVSTSSVSLTEHTGEGLSLPTPNHELSSPVSPAKQVKKPSHSTECGCSPKKLALSNDDDSRSPEKIVLSDSSGSEDELPLSDRVINHQTSYIQAHTSRPAGTKDDPIVI